MACSKTQASRSPTRPVYLNLGTGVITALDQDTDVGYWGWLGERISQTFRPADLNVINGNEAVGTQYSDYLVASAGAEGSGEGYCVLYGAGNDLLVATEANDNAPIRLAV